MTTVRRRQLTARDQLILTALDFTPLTARQLQRLSAAWPQPFRSLRKTRERIFELTQLALVQVARYAALAPGQPENYYRLSRAGFAHLRGPDERPPTKGYFSEIAISRQAHTKALADFLVHVQVSAHAVGVGFTDFYRENTIKLMADGESAYPDAAFALAAANGRQYRFFVEIDFGTERLRSTLTDATWQRKARVYDRTQDDHRQTRFRVLVVSARDSEARLENILATAIDEQRNPDRSLFLATTLGEFLQTPDAVTEAVFRDHRGERSALVVSRHSQLAVSPAFLSERRGAATLATLPVRS